MYVLDSSIMWAFGFIFDSQPMDIYVLQDCMAACMYIY